MKSPEEKYRNDPQYHMLVDMLENMIHDAQFTPSELREACIFACTKYEMNRCRPRQIYPAFEEERRFNEQLAASIGSAVNFKANKQE